MYIPPFTISAEAINKIADISRLMERYAIRMEQEDALLLRKANKIKTIHSSLAIEGNTLDENQVRDIVNGKAVVAPLRQIQEVKNAIATYEQFPHLDAFKESDLLRAHGIMMQALVENAGQYRKGGVGVFSDEGCVHMAPPAERVPYLMADLFDWLKHSPDHLLVRSCVFHYEFEFIHPFADGNGRTGRLWQTLILRKWEPIFTYLPIESMILEHQADYYAALNAANTQGSATVFIEFMLEMILEALKNIYVKQHIKSPEDQLLVLLKSDPRMTIPVMAEHLGLSDRQIRRLIASLKAQNRLHREGSNKTGRWVVSRKSR